ncbi:VRR-NUC domain-containing protein [Neorhizobium sp. BT27B]|uniref:VRR-NUC domain-containing protein n=1 Tax=Neorhizobium sp. BT27B TaxID=3142625 RepID=UPI003D2B62DA
MSRSQQTVRINGARTIIRTSATGKIATKPAPPREWELQAAQVRALRRMPEYGKEFLLASDQNAAKRGPRSQQEAVAAGMTPGEADLRIYLAGGQIRMIENKVGKGRLSTQQKDRHAALAKLGHNVVVVSSITPAEAASQAVDLVQGWLAVA